MSKKRFAASILVVLFGIALNIGVLCYDRPMESKLVKVDITVASDTDQQIDIYYNLEKGSDEFTEKLHETEQYTAPEDKQLSFEIPCNAKNLRLDITGETAVVSGIGFRYADTSRAVSGEELSELSLIHDAQAVLGQKGLEIVSEGVDPFVVWDSSAWEFEAMVENAFDIMALVLKLVLCLVIDVIIVIGLRHFRALIQVPKEIIENRKLIFNLAKNDFKTQYAGSYLGIFWAFVQPVVTVLVYWFVFEKGLRAGEMNTKAGITVPFVLWLIAGIVPWFFFQDAWNGATNALMQYSYLVKKVVFKISILPIVKLVSALFVHMFFVAFAVILYSCYGRMPDLYLLQIFYYTFCMFVLVLGISYATCAMVGFFRDLTQIISIILQVGVWITPIMWNFDGIQLPSVLRTIFKLNPMYYVVSGYRDAFINKVWFWEHPELTMYFWVLTALLFGMGMTVFRKLKVHFADVL